MEFNLWMKDPPASSYPACIAVKCAQLQSRHYGEQYLRMLRETVMLNGINIARQDVLVQSAGELAKESPGFNLKTFKQHLFGNEGIEAFKQDMQETKNYGISRFPTLILRYQKQHPVLITGYRPYASLTYALRKLSPDLKAVQKGTSAQEYRSHWLTITKREIEEALK
jgi:putative protein-disulfide isomerase